MQEAEKKQEYHSILLIRCHNNEKMKMMQKRSAPSPAAPQQFQAAPLVQADAQWNRGKQLEARRSGLACTGPP